MKNQGEYKYKTRENSKMKMKLLSQVFYVTGNEAKES